jgi:hypothetical protein
MTPEEKRAIMREFASKGGKNRVAKHGAIGTDEGRRKSLETRRRNRDEKIKTQSEGA